jgi:hypothetical protein
MACGGLGSGRGAQAALGRAPQQAAVGLVGDEELREGVHLREDGLCGAPVGGGVGLAGGELRVTDQIRQQRPDYFPVVGGAVPGLPCGGEACPQVLR